MEPMSILWLILIVVLVVFEAVTAGLICIWFAIGAVASFLVSLFVPDSTVWQFAAFFVVSALMLLITRPILKKIIPKVKPTPMNAERVIGRRAMVTQTISPDKSGRVFVDGQSWAAVSDTQIAIDSVCIVTKIEGATLHVKPQ